MANYQQKVQLIFEADTTKATQQINSIVNSLRNIQTGKNLDLIDSAGFREASLAAAELEQHLKNAFNTTTNKLDLSRFNASLTASNTSLTDYYNRLQAIGPTGEQAFLQVAKALSTADISSVHLNNSLTKFLTTLKNTAKWQISTTLIHGLQSGIQQAYSYAQQLDKSLNSIQIVTGQTAEQMAKFAVEANRAAQSLNTTTTRYTDASLIFFQQGMVAFFQHC